MSYQFLIHQGCLYCCLRTYLLVHCLESPLPKTSVGSSGRPVITIYLWKAQNRLEAVSGKQRRQNVAKKVPVSQLSPHSYPIKDNILHLIEQKIYDIKRCL